MDNAAVLRDAILGKLRSGEWRQGHRIDTERQLSESFGIGRSTVRRVLAQLKEAGLITQTVGSGTYVSDGFEPDALGGASPAGLVAMSNAIAGSVSPAELMEARLAIEPSIVEMIIRNASQNDFAKMAHCCDKAEAADSMEEFEVWDGQLHETIALAAHNSLVTSIFRLISQGRAQDDWGALKRHSLSPERRQAYQAEHRQIVGALTDRDLARATACTRDHLLHVRRNLLGS
ncbi:FadR/GntR family transcriptional regulator [Variovorax saccharolyticus]|uniref:FadR/GntR family transcriptional regulator n=1 Tax=Variovorax saccharolyticus TaxID=3053516 RepID=UPI0025769491|nr:FCD domain-containing protein [Variovorax sp. J31P216]MDM0029762.1 FCD domain-containing protein [Variovorax sp. J31P216]